MAVLRLLAVPSVLSSSARLATLISQQPLSQMSFARRGMTFVLQLQNTDTQNFVIPGQLLLVGASHHRPEWNFEGMGSLRADRLVYDAIMLMVR